MHEPDLLGMAVVASGFVGERAHEVVRLMATLAVGPSVKVLVRSRNLVAAAAALGPSIEPRARRMRVVASDTGTGDAAARMIGVLVAMAFRARPFGRAVHVVRSVAALAIGVLAHALSAEHVHVFVTAATGDRFRLFELMRAVAADALAVALGKDRRFGHDRILRGVTGGAPAARLGRGRVLVLVTDAAGGAR